MPEQNFYEDVPPYIVMNGNKYLVDVETGTILVDRQKGFFASFFANDADRAQFFAGLAFLSMVFIVFMWLVALTFQYIDGGSSQKNCNITVEEFGNVMKNFARLVKKEESSDT